MSSIIKTELKTKDPLNYKNRLKKKNQIPQRTCALLLISSPRAAKEKYPKMFVIVTASHQNIRKHLSDCNNTTIVRDSVSNGSIDGEDQLFGQ